MIRISLKCGLALLLVLVSSPAFAQGGGATSSIAGVVQDTQGGVVPGASILATNDATSGKFTAISGTDGSFTIPALAIGTYTVTISLQGFKNAVLKGVDVTAGGPANVRAKLEVGGLTESVTVEGASAMIQTQTSDATTTISTNQINYLPVTSRNTLNFVQFLPGVQTQGNVRNSVDRRPAGEHDQHHRRRRQRPGQPPEDDGRLLRAHEPAARRGRAGVADERGAGRGRERPGRDADQVHDALGHEPVPDEPLPLLPERHAQLEHLLEPRARAAARAD